LVGETINLVLAAWGTPHLHAGIGIRHLKDDLYECRVDIARRLGFVVQRIGRELVVFLGDHNEIRKLIKSLA
jgi:hypothetical protein